MTIKNLFLNIFTCSYPFFDKILIFPKAFQHTFPHPVENFSACVKLYLRFVQKSPLFYENKGICHCPLNVEKSTFILNKL